MVDEIQKPSIKIPVISAIIGVIFFIIILLIPSKKKKENATVIYLLNELEEKTSAIHALKGKDKEKKIILEKDLIEIRKQLKDEQNKIKELNKTIEKNKEVIK